MGQVAIYLNIAERDIKPHWFKINILTLHLSYKPLTYYPFTMVPYSVHNIFFFFFFINFYFPFYIIQYMWTYSIQLNVGIADIVCIEQSLILVV